MTDHSSLDYLSLDRPEVSRFLFHPRPDYSKAPTASNILEELIPVADDAVIGSCFHISGKEMPNILFFHGNGEIVSDYNDLGQMYTRMGINFIPVDYRGYGKSTGAPTVSAMMADCHTIFRYVRSRLTEMDHTGPLIVMGRSLGSASAIELVFKNGGQIDGLIVESGFAYAGPLLRLIGINTEAIGFSEDKGFNNTDKIADYTGPVLIIHAEYDHIIPYSDGKALYEASRSPDKTLVKIAGANHNNIFMVGLQEYMKSIKTLTEKTND